MWKWDEIGMDFVTGLPRTPKGNDAIWVIIDRLTKTAHFLPVRTTYNGAKLAQLYIENVVKLHGIPDRIVSIEGHGFTSKFRKSLQEAMGTKLDFSTAYHPRRWPDVKGKSSHGRYVESVRSHLWHQLGSRPSVCEFSYNNGRQAALGMAPFEALYGRKCRTPLMWHEVGERSLVGPALIKEARRKGGRSRARPKEAQSRQELCRWQKDGNLVLKRETRCVTYSRDKEIPDQRKTRTRYIGPYKVVRRIGKVAYKLELPESMRDIHDVFHVSQLRKCPKPDRRRVTTGSSLSRETNQNFGYGRPENTDYNNQVMQSSLEPSRRRGGNLGKEKMLSERTPPSVRKPTRSRGRDLF
ncbi:hypothetical protein U9M48_019400 [Paspalum notatum var. saurae]|uniref:Integrase catalytic domain-containing protein n=1 Tax=Paspalum notatum var. saurae TaxID=547442 RepID=A0AAQ3TC98_PASNO